MPIYQLNPGPSMGENLGTSLGTGLSQGLSTGLQLLAKQKMQQLQQRQQITNTSKAFQAAGFPKDLADRLAYFSEPMQKEIYHEAGPMFAQNMLQGQASMPNQMLEDLQNIKPVDEISTGQSMPQKLTPEQDKSLEMGMRNLGLLGDPLAGMSSALLEQNQPAREQILPKTTKETPLLKQAPKTEQVGAGAKPIPAVATPKIAPMKSTTIAKPVGPMTRSQQTAYNSAVKAQQALDKSGEKFIKDFYDGYKETRENDMRLGKMETLINSKQLNRPVPAAILDALSKGLVGGLISFGKLNLKSLLTGETQEFDKLSKDMIRGAKKIFGSRITDADMATFLDMIPTISQSRDAKRRVIHNMRLFNEGVYAREKALRSILDDNGGHMPRNIEMLIEERAKPELDDISRRFKEGLPAKEKKEKGFFPTEIKNPLPKVLNAILGKG